MKRRLQADPAKVEAIVDRPVYMIHKDLRKWLGLANSLLKYNQRHADMARPLFDLLKSIWSGAGLAQSMILFK